jgi:iron complex transport system substrate-binding protein
MPASPFRVRFAAFALAFAFVASAACVSPIPATAAAAAGVVRPRIVSLLPSLTEDLFAIGAGPQVVAVSDYTDYPPAAAKLPQVASFTSLDAERIARLHPDLVVGIEAQRALVGDLRRIGVRVELVRNDSFDDLFAAIARLGALSGHVPQAAELAARLHARTALLVSRVPRGPRPSVFVVLGIAPIYTIGDGSYIAHLIALAGGRNASGVRDAYPRYSAEALVARQPDVIVADAMSGLRGALAAQPWRSLRAVQAGRVYVLADADILERPGPRYNDGLAWLIARLHPHVAR